MKAIPFPEIKPDVELTAKQNEATEQMQRLLKRLAKGEIHRTLSIKDRTLLKNEGFAPDLVNNVVFKTMRLAEPEQQKYQDRLVVGFTDAAIDPSIYRCRLFSQKLSQASQGCCAFCQSELASTGSGQLYHFKPASIVEVNGQVFRSPYLDLAYQPENLHYCCRACAEDSKQAQFPTLQQAQSQVVNTALLLNPYTDEPTDFIGFNPLNGQAYPLDLLTPYLVETEKIAAEKVKEHLLANPLLIPNLVDFFADQPLNQATAAFVQWCKNVNPYQFKGYQTIEVFCLNRPALVTRRFERLQMIFASKNKTNVSSNSEYSSCIKDARSTWQATKNNAKYDWHNLYQQQLKLNSLDENKVIPEWMKSRLVYFVRETELNIKGKRRLVYLGDADFIYGSNNPEKSIFMPIDWRKDINNPIIVRTKQGQWQTSFIELAGSHPLEIYKLFSEHEVLIEGDYPPAQQS